MNTVQPIRDREKLEQIKTLLMRMSYRDYFLFVFGINTGLRISDILKLKVSDVKGKTHITIKESKTKKAKRFYLSEPLRNNISNYVSLMSNDDYLFPSQKGKAPISRVQAYRILNAAAEKVGLTEIGTHTLRKTFGYWHYQQHKDVAILQQIFNHTSPSVTLRYIGVNQDLMDNTIKDFYL